MALINCEFELLLSQIEKYVLSGGENIYDAGAAANVTDAKLYVPVVTLLNEENAKLEKTIK